MMHSSKATRARFVVIAFLCSLTFILYLDRVCISQAMNPIRKELNLNKTQMGYVAMAFTLAYGLFEVPTGHWGDRIGARAVLTRIAVWWSLFTALTAACFDLASLLVVRFLFGAGEAGALPNVARVIARWFPLAERGRVQGLVQTTMVLGGAAAPMVAAYIIEELGWRWAFVFFGLAGVAWASLFWIWFRDDPARHPAVNPVELDLIGAPGPAGQTHQEGIPWKAALGNRSVWLLGGIMVFGAFNSYVYLTWFPTYLQEGRGVGQIEAGWLSSLVLGGAAAGMLLGGFLADLVTRPGGNRLLRRRLLGSSGYALASAALVAGISCESPRLTALFAGLSLMALTATLSSWWSCVSEISGRHLGALFGLMNGMGVFGAMGSQYFFGAFPDWRLQQGVTGRAQWDPAFGVCVVVLLLAAGCWACYTSRSVVEERQEQEEAHPG
jgi:MFS family permease